MRYLEEETVFTQDLIWQFIEQTKERTRAKVVLPVGSEP
jgi:hypothetical protein